jgi:hypothetical protein
MAGRFGSEPAGYKGRACGPISSTQPIIPREKYARGKPGIAPCWRDCAAREVSGDFLPPSPLAEKTTARQDQARQSGTDNGTGDYCRFRQMKVIDLNLCWRNTPAKKAVERR